MAKYKYNCQKCGKNFDYTKSLFERENRIKCPKCGAQDVKNMGPVADNSDCNSAPRGGG
jgi:putative FmdB family regulatory protein